MAWDVEDTIVALATARRGGVRGIIRMAGPQTVAVWRQCFDGPGQWHETRQAAAWPGHLNIQSAHRSAPATALPGTLHLWPTTASFTRQPAAEFHTLGAVPLLDAGLEQLCRAGCRLARPGEFTLRAFLSGRLDLLQAEAVLGVIDADSDRQLNVALEQLAGGLTTPLQQIRNQLLDLLADLEAGLDFADEDIQFVSPPACLTRITTARQAVASLSGQLTSRECQSPAATVVLYGRPNVGKSSLWNQLTQHGQALVSELAGTTRDYLAAELPWTDFPCLLIDTAGVAHFEQLDAIARQAQLQTQRATQQSVVKVLCLDQSRLPDAWEAAELQRADSHRLVVANKADLPPAQYEWPAETIVISARDRHGLDTLRGRLIQLLMTTEHTESASIASTAVRCRDSLERAAACLSEAAELCQSAAGDELVAADLRAALHDLGEVAGAVYTDDVLDRVFSRFCIGK